MFNEKTRNILLNGSEQEIKELMLSMEAPNHIGYMVANDFIKLKYTEKLVKKTWVLAIATWVLAMLNALLVLITFLRTNH